MFVPIILGTGREGNNSQKVANYLLGEINKNHEAEVVSPKDYLRNNFTERIGNERELDESGKKYQQIISKADAIVVIIPEYNRSFPGELKLLFDLLYGEYRGKKFHLVGVSNGGTGGARAVESFMHAIIGVEAIPMKPKLLFTNVDEVFDQSGNLVKQEFQERVEKFVENL